MASTDPQPGGVSDSKPALRYVDIGINLTDPIFRGVYHGTSRHPDDLSDVIGRAAEVGCTKLLVTGSDLKCSSKGLSLTREYPGTVYSTAGIHPCSSQIFSSKHAGHDQEEHTVLCDPDPSKPIPEDEEPCPTRTEELIAELEAFVKSATSTDPSTPSGLVAFGEFGLDYDRLHYCSKRVQLHSFAAQLKLAASLKPQLPLFLHSRAAHPDFVRLLKGAFGERLERLERGGVVHSFTGTEEEMRELADLGLYIGVNGCSLKTAENCDVVRKIPLDRIMLETDGPWCEVRPSHEGYKYLLPPSDPAQETTAPEPPVKSSRKNQPKAAPAVAQRYKVLKKERWEKGAMVKGRNEPCTIERVAKIVAAIKGIDVEVLCEAAWENTVKVFPIGEA